MFPQQKTHAFGVVDNLALYFADMTAILPASVT